jgi:hypothetical protein
MQWRHVYRPPRIGSSGVAFSDVRASRRDGLTRSGRPFLPGSERGLGCQWHRPACGARNDETTMVPGLRSLFWSSSGAVLPVRLASVEGVFVGACLYYSQSKYHVAG